MIAEASILAASSWPSDQTFSETELPDSYLYDNDNFIFNNLDLELSLATEGRSTSDYDSLGSSSHVPSVASSECGDDFLSEIGSSDVNLVNWINDNCLESAFSEMLGSNFSDVLPLSTPDWSLIEEFPPTNLHESNVNAISNIPDPRVRRHNKNLDPFTIRSWSDLSSVDQVKAVEALSHVVSSKLGLREQLDVIRIIDPSAVISTSDKEFVIDLNCLNNDKWLAVRDYVKHAKWNSHNSISKRGRTPSEIGPSSKQKHVTSIRRHEEVHSRNQLNDAKRKYTKKLNKEQQMQVKALKQRQKKEQKQLMKELKSGLFAREEVLSLSQSVLEEDIDILD